MQRIAILLFCLIPYCSLSQINARIFADGAPVTEKVFTDTLDMKTFLQSLQVSWIDQGYYFSGVDSTEVSDSSLLIYTHRGEKFLMTIAGLKGRKLSKTLSNYLSSYTNNGYPFASIRLDSIRAGGQALSAKLHISRGPEIRFDSILFRFSYSHLASKTK